MDGEVHVARLAAVQSRLAFAGDTNLLPIFDARRHMGLELLAVHAQGDRGAFDRLTEGQGDLRLAVGTLLRARRLLVFAARPAERRTCAGACTAAEH